MLDSQKRSAATERRRFSCRRSIVADVAHVAVAGVVDDVAVPELDRALRLAWASAPAPAEEVVLDLGGLEAMCFHGAKVVIVADHRIRRAGGCLSVRRGPSNFDWLLDFIDLCRVIDLVDRSPLDPRAAACARTEIAAYFRSRADHIDPPFCQPAKSASRQDALLPLSIARNPYDCC